MWNVQKETVNSHHKRYTYDRIYIFYSFLLRASFFSDHHLVSMCTTDARMRAVWGVGIQIVNYLGIIGLLLLLLHCPWASYFIVLNKSVGWFVPCARAVLGCLACHVPARRDWLHNNNHAECVFIFCRRVTLHAKWNSKIFFFWNESMIGIADSECNWKLRVVYSYFRWFSDNFRFHRFVGWTFSDFSFFENSLFN